MACAFACAVVLGSGGLAAAAAPPAEPGADAQPTAQLPAGAGPADAVDPDDGTKSEPSLPIVVTVQGTAGLPIASRREPTVASYAIEGEALREPGLTLADALARVPGVQTTRSGGDVDLATAAVRGASSAQTPVYLAGIRLNDELTGAVDLSTLPLWMIHRVEIYRGTSPDHADRDGIGGAILLEPELPRQARAGGGLGVGSFGWRQGHWGLSLGGAEAGAAFALRHETTRNDFAFVDDRGTRFDEGDDRRSVRRNADASTTDLWSVGRVRLGATGSLTTLVNVLRREAGAPGLPLLGALHARAEQARTIAGATARLPCSSAGGPDAPGGCELEVSSSLLSTRYRLRDPADELGLGGSVENEARSLGQGISARLGLTEWLELRGGGRAEQAQLAVVRGGAQRLAADRLLSRFEVGARAHVERLLDVVLSGALECHATRAAGALEGCGALEPVGRAGIRWQPVDLLSLYGNVGRAVRVPTLGELHGTSAVVVGNPELAPERGLSGDLGATLTGRWGPVALYGQLTGFARFVDDLIAYRRSSFGVIRPYNVASARVLGLELAAGASFWQRLEAGLSLTALDPRDTSDARLVANDLLPLESRLVVAPFLEASTPAWPAAGIDRASIAARYHYRSSRLADPAGLVVLDEQGQLDLVASVLLLSERLALRGALSNLLAEQSVDLVGYPLPGRAAHIEVEAWW